MNKPLFFILAAGLILPLIANLSCAADANSPEIKLRETLRNTMLQLRTAETDRANLQAAQVEAEQKNRDLTAKVEALIKQAAEDKKNLNELSSKISDQDVSLARLRTELSKTQEALKQAAETAKTKEAERARLAGEIILLQRRTADIERRNLALYNLGNEILTRYEKFGLGTALTAREPFTGLTRTKLENLVQDYQDKLSKQTVAADEEQKSGGNSKPVENKNRKSSGQD